MVTHVFRSEPCPTAPPPHGSTSSLWTLQFPASDQSIPPSPSNCPSLLRLDMGRPQYDNIAERSGKWKEVGRDHPLWCYMWLDFPKQ